MTHTDQSRAEFEKHVLAPNGFDENGAGWVIRNADGTYRHENIQARWMTWQAARATTEQSSGVELPEPGLYSFNEQASIVTGDERKFTRTTYTKFKPDEPHTSWYTEQQVRALLSGVKDSLTVAPAAQGWIELTDEDRDRAFNSLPDMLDGFLKKWGWLHFAKAIEQICREKNSPQPPKEQT